MHSFAKQAPLMRELLQDNDLHNFIRRAANNARTQEAIDVYSTEEFKAAKEVVGDAYEGHMWSPEYFGSAIEFLAECFFVEFGAAFNLKFDRSVDDWESSELDTGIDHYATTLKEVLMKPTRRPTYGSPVYIQTKGTLNPRKMFLTNDGSRLPNFFMSAQAEACRSACTYQARYVLFTTGKGIHHRLNTNSGQLCEVINYNKIKSFVDGNVLFWNVLRQKAGVEQHKVVPKIDVEASLN